MLSGSRTQSRKKDLKKEPHSEPGIESDVHPQYAPTIPSIDDSSRGFQFILLHRLDKLMLNRNLKRGGYVILEQSLQVED